jgi:hypothetical protein
MPGPSPIDWSINRRLAQAIASRPGTTRNDGKNNFVNHAERNSFLIDIVTPYNHTRLRCLNDRASAEGLAQHPVDNTQAATTTSNYKEDLR